MHLYIRSCVTWGTCLSCDIVLVYSEVLPIPDHPDSQVSSMSQSPTGTIPYSLESRRLVDRR